jgi:hypothetical protein
MKIEDSHFWPAERTRLWVYVSIVIIIAALLAFVIYAWVVYQQKGEALKMNSNHGNVSTAVPLNVDDTNATKIDEPSLSPLSTTTNPN